jgi:hypothetical protein
MHLVKPIDPLELIAAVATPRPDLRVDTPRLADRV